MAIFGTPAAPLTGAFANNAINTEMRKKPPRWTAARSDVVAAHTTVRTDGWSSYQGLGKLGFRPVDGSVSEGGLAVVEAAGNDDEFRFGHSVHEPVLGVDPPRPVARQV